LALKPCALTCTTPPSLVNPLPKSTVQEPVPVLVTVFGAPPELNEYRASGAPLTGGWASR
jgi:hypothetical protein